MKKLCEEIYAKFKSICEKYPNVIGIVIVILLFLFCGKCCYDDLQDYRKSADTNTESVRAAENTYNDIKSTTRDLESTTEGIQGILDDIRTQKLDQE